MSTEIATKEDFRQLELKIETAKFNFMKWLVLTMILLNSLLLAAIKLL